MKIAIIAGLWLISASVPAPEDPVERVSTWLARGLQAEAEGDARAMLLAAQGLESAGARPGPAGQDLAARWHELARRRGIKDETPWRGRALGPAYRQGRLEAGGALSTEQVFLAGQKAVVALVPQPGRRLNMRIAAPDKAICDRVVAPPRASCAWLPLFTTRVKIDVSNQAAVAASYFLVSN